MGQLQIPQCEYCGGTRIDEAGVCEECGNEKRKVLVTSTGPTHKDWYSLEETLVKEESKAKPKPTELPENMKVPHHQEWYDLDPQAGQGPVKKKGRPPPPVARNAGIAAAIVAVLILMGAMGYLLVKIHQDVPIGFGAHP